MRLLTDVLCYDKTVKEAKKMDEFYNELYGDLIFEWIKTLCIKHEFPNVFQKEEETYKKASINKEDYHGSITLWLNEHIIEEEIKDKDQHTI